MFLKSASIVAFATAAALSMSVGTSFAANGFANGGFENTTPINPLPPGGATSPAANWLSAPTGFPVNLSTTTVRTGSQSALLSVPGGFGGSTLFQNSIDQGGLPPLTVGDLPVLTFWARGDASTTGNALFALRYLDNIGNILANSGNIFFHQSLSTSSWTQITYNGPVVPAGATAAFIEINTAVGPILDNRPNAVFIDDLNLEVSAIPEPVGASMLGLGGLAIMARRRRA